MEQLFQYNAYGLLNLSAGVFDAMLGFIVYLNNPKSSLHRVFFIFTVVSSIWVISYGLMSLFIDGQIAASMLAFAYIGVPFIPPTLYQLSRRVRGQNRFTALEVLSYITAIPFVLLMSTSQSLICDIRLVPWGRFNFFKNTEFAWTYFLLLMLYYTAFIGAAYWNFVAAYRGARNLIQKRQFRNILMGFSIVYFGMIDFAVAKGAPIYPPGFMVLTLLVGIIAYSIVRHQLWEINVAIKRASLIVLSYTFLICFSIPMVYPLARKALGNTLSIHVWLFLAFSCLFGLIFSTGPLIYSFLERHTFWLKKHITTGLTHELKSPIGAIRGALDLITDRIESPNVDPRVIKDYLQMMDRNTARLELFVKDLLHIARAQDGIVDIEREPFDLALLTRETIDMFQSAALRNGNSFNMKVPTEFHIDAEKNKVAQILSNVVSNAIKFTRNGTIEISLERQSRHALFSITDSGDGIPPADLERIFERFYQGRNVNKGSGIGLTIAKAWVEAHGGEIWAESEGVRRGTKVIFTLPMGVSN